MVLCKQSKEEEDKSKTKDSTSRCSSSLNDNEACRIKSTTRLQHNQVALCCTETSVYIAFYKLYRACGGYLLLLLHLHLLLSLFGLNECHLCMEGLNF